MLTKAEGHYALMGGRAALGIALQPETVSMALLSDQSVLIHETYPFVPDPKELLLQSVQDAYRQFEDETFRRFGIGILRLKAAGIVDGTGHLITIDGQTTVIGGWLHHQLTGQWVLGPTAGALLPPSLSADQRPEFLPSGALGGVLSAEGARRLESKTCLFPGAVLCPPEADTETLLPLPLWGQGLKPAVVIAAIAAYAKEHFPGETLLDYLTSCFTQNEKEETP